MSVCGNDHHFDGFTCSREKDHVGPCALTAELDPTGAEQAFDIFMTSSSAEESKARLSDWLKKRDSETASRALEEAAREVPLKKGIWVATSGMSDWLRARAVRVRKDGEQ